MVSFFFLISYVNSRGKEGRSVSRKPVRGFVSSSFFGQARMTISLPRIPNSLVSSVTISYVNFSRGILSTCSACPRASSRFLPLNSCVGSLFSFSMRLSLFLSHHPVHDVLLADLEAVVGQPVEDQGALEIHEEDGHDHGHDEHHPGLGGIG